VRLFEPAHKPLKGLDRRFSALCYPCCYHSQTSAFTGLPNARANKNVFLENRILSKKKLVVLLHLKTFNGASAS